MAYINGKKVLHATVNIRNGISGEPVYITSEQQMNNILTNATSEDIGKIYQYTGETTETYEQGAYYILTEVT